MPMGAILELSTLLKPAETSSFICFPAGRHLYSEASKDIFVHCLSLAEAGRHLMYLSLYTAWPWWPQGLRCSPEGLQAYLLTLKAAA